MHGNGPVAQVPAAPSEVQASSAPRQAACPWTGPPRPPSIAQAWFNLVLICALPECSAMKSWETLAQSVPRASSASANSRSTMGARSGLSASTSCSMKVES